MIVVIVAGGSGTRLWPLSTPGYPKHLLKVNDDKLSLLQHSYERARRLTDKIYVVSESGHMEHVKAQLSDLPDEAFINEPARRGTANCIAAALVYIKARHARNEPVVSIHADHFIRDIDGFEHSIKTAAEVSCIYKKIVLVGVEPDYPATGFGYIQKANILDDSQLVYNVHSFKEKPDFATARIYLKSGNYLWNCGYFVGSLDTFIEAMKEHAPELYGNFTKLDQVSENDYEVTYLSFDSVAIDYALIEKVPDLLVVPASFDWMDMGSYRDLHRATSSDENRNSIKGKKIELEEVENSFIYNFEDKPLAVIGLDNIVVVNTPDGILVARKDVSQKVGEISKKFQKAEK